MGEMKRGMRNWTLAALVTGMISGCSWLESVTPDKRPDYKTAKTVETLEVPPDLTSSTLDDSLVVPEYTPASSATLSDYTSERRTGTARPSSDVLPSPEGMELKRDGDQRWLVVQGGADPLWSRVREFWLQNGFLLTREDPRVGVMETNWAENRADIADDPIRRVLGKVLDPLYSAATRDKFRTRLERGREPGTTEIYLTHRGMEEVLRGGPAETQTTAWQPRESDPELEIEMLRRLMLHLGVEEARADTLAASAQQAAPQAELVKDGEQTRLTLFEDFSRAWRRTGVALDRTGFAVEDRNRDEGVYYVRYIDPDREANKGGWLSKLGFGGDDDDEQTQYQIKLSPEGSNTRISVLNQEGQVDTSKTAARILTLLHEQLR